MPHIHAGTLGYQRKSFRSILSPLARVRYCSSWCRLLKDCNSSNTVWSHCLSKKTVLCCFKSLLPGNYLFLQHNFVCPDCAFSKVIWNSSCQYIIIQQAGPIYSPQAVAKFDWGSLWIPPNTKWQTYLKHYKISFVLCVCVTLLQGSWAMTLCCNVKRLNVPET